MIKLQLRIRPTRGPASPLMAFQAHMPNRFWSRSVGRIALVTGTSIGALLSCGRDVTAPTGGAVRYSRGFALNPLFPVAYQAAGSGASALVPFDRVRIVLRRSDGRIALDTVVTFPAGSEGLTVSLSVALAPGAPSAGEPLVMNLGYVNTAGDTVFKAGPVTVVATAPGSGAPPAPIQADVRYTGRGANATRVVISPRSTTVFESEGFALTAVARDASGQPLPGTPIVWTSLDQTRATITAPGAGAGVARAERGVARVVAQLLTGAADTAVVQVLLRPSVLAVQSGSAQGATVGAELALPIVVRVGASDGIGVGGVTVTFAVTAGGGSVGNVSAVTDSSGLARTTWRLGSAAGAQTVSASAAGLSGSPVTFSATALAVQAARLSITAQPVSTTAGATLAAVTVAAVDANNNVATTFTGPVTVSLGGAPGPTVLGGTTTVNAVAGVAIFSTLTIGPVGAGYSLTASSPDLTLATTTPFDITAAAAARLVFTTQPSDVLAGALIDPPVVVSATDARGNPTPSFVGTVTLGLTAGGPASVLAGTATATAVAGVATFPQVRVTAAGVGYQLSATAPGMSSAVSTPFDVRLGPAAITNRMWVGGTSSAWATAANWRPAIVPVAGDSVFIPGSAGGRLVVLSGPVSVKHLYIGAGASLNTAGFALSVSGNLDAGTTIVGTGSVTLAGTGTLAGAIRGPLLVVSGGVHTVAGPTEVAGDVTVGAGASIAFIDQFRALVVGGNLDATAGPITGGGEVVLIGNGTFTGTIAARVFVVNGIRTPVGATAVTGSIAVYDGGRLDLNGLTLPITGDFTTVGTGTLRMANSADLLTVSGNATFTGGTESGLLTAGEVSVGGDFSASGLSYDASGTHFLRMNSAGAAQTLRFAASRAGRGIRDLKFDNAGAKSVAGDVNVLGDVFVNASSAPVTGPAGRVNITGNLNDFTSSADTLGGWRVATTVMNGGGMIAAWYMSTDLIVSAGTVRMSYADTWIWGNLSVNGTTAMFEPGGGEGGSEVVVSGNFETVNGGKLRIVNSGDDLRVLGDVRFAGGSTAGLLTGGDFSFYGNFVQAGGAPDAFAGDRLFDSYPGKVTWRLPPEPEQPPPGRLPPTVFFANPGFGPNQSHFGTFEPRDTVTLLSDVFATGVVESEGLTVNDVGEQCCLVIRGTNKTLTTRGAEIFNMRFEGVRWVVEDGDDVLSIYDIIFSGMDPTVTQFEVRRSAGTVQLPQPLPLFSNWRFETTPTTGLYVKAVDTDGVAPFLTFNLSGATPATGNGKTAAVGGAVINWPAPTSIYAAARLQPTRKHPPDAIRRVRSPAFGRMRGSSPP